MNKQMLESFDRMYKEGNKKLRESSNMDKINAVLNKIAFIDVSGSNSAPKMIEVSQKLAKDAGAQKLMYFAGKIGTNPEGLGGGTYYKPIQKYLDDNNISKAIVVTDEDVEMNEDGKDLQKDPRVTIIRNDKYHDKLEEKLLNEKFNPLYIINYQNYKNKETEAFIKKVIEDNAIEDAIAIIWDCIDNDWRCSAQEDAYLDSLINKYKNN